VQRKLHLSVTEILSEAIRRSQPSTSGSMSGAYPRFALLSLRDIRRMSEQRTPDEERALDRIGEREGDPPTRGEGGGGSDLEESYAAPEDAESERTDGGGGGDGGP